MTEQPEAPVQPDVTTPVRLADGTTARVVVAPITLTPLTVPQTVTRARVSTTIRGTTTSPSTPILRGRAVLPAGSSGGGDDGGSSGGVGPVAGAWTYVQRYPLLTWRFVHPLGRRPQVTVFLGLEDDAEEVDTDVSSTATEVVVEWAEPTVGSVVLR